MKDGAVGDGLTGLGGNQVGILSRRAHAATLVGIEGGIEVLDEDISFGEGFFEVNEAILDREVLSDLGQAAGDLLEDQAFIMHLDHFSECVYVFA